MSNAALAIPRARLDIYCAIQVSLSLLSRYDSRFGFNGYYSNLQGQQFPGPAIHEGWHHPAVVDYLRSRGSEGRHALPEYQLGEIEWNLGRLLERYQQSACVLPVSEPYRKRGFEPEGECHAA